jgi:hypothetical protein
MRSGDNGGQLAAATALIVLVAVAVALLCAAAYAVFSNPHSHEGRQRKTKIRNGFGLAGGILLGVVLMGTLVVGAGIAFFGVESSRVSKTPAFLLAAVSLVCITLLVQRWAKHFAGWVGYGVLNGLIMTSSGHLLNNPTIPIRRSVALTMTGLCLISAVVCRRFMRNYQLNWVDKVALVAWLLAFTVMANVEKYGLIAFTIGCAGLVIAWLYTRSHHRPHTLRSTKVTV